MKKLLLLSLVLVTCCASQAQDTLFDKKNYSIIAKVIEVTQNDIRYKKFDNLNGPTYIVPKEEISFIKYANGSTEEFSTYRRRFDPKARSNKLNGRPIHVLPSNNGTHLISSGLLIFGSPNAEYDYLNNMNRAAVFASYIHYEKQFVEGRIAATVMPFIGWNRKAYGAALGLKSYPKNHGTTQFHIGPQINLSVQDYAQTRYNNSYQYRETLEYQTLITSLVVNFGFNVNVSPNWVITNDFSFGGVLGNSKYKDNESYNNYFYNGIVENVVLGIHMGLAYRFK